MRIAVLSDIHGNGTAFEAVLADLRTSSPDLVLHGGDLTDNGSSPVEVCESIRALGWAGVCGNTDEMLFRPESLSNYFAPRPQLHRILAGLEEMAAFTRSALGQSRLKWLSELPMQQTFGGLALVHASPSSCWVAPSRDAKDEEILANFASLSAECVVYGHTHVPFVRSVCERWIVNCGSVGLPYDGDPRASYLLLTDMRPEIRRVSYDVDRECQLLRDSGMPHFDWVIRSLRAAGPVAP